MTIEKIFQQRKQSLVEFILLSQIDNQTVWPGAGMAPRTYPHPDITIGSQFFANPLTRLVASCAENCRPNLTNSFAGGIAFGFTKAGLLRKRHMFRLDKAMAVSNPTLG